MTKTTRHILSLLMVVACLAVSLQAKADFTKKFSFGAYDYMLDTSAKTAQVVSSDYYTGYFSINIPASITYNGASYSVVSIGAEAFKNCTKVTEVTLPASLTSIASSSFDGCSGVTKLTENGSALTYSVVQDMPYIKDFVISISSTRTSVPSYFQGSKKLETVTVRSSSTKTISTNAFNGCSNLKTFSSLYGISNISQYAFQGCTSLTSFTTSNASPSTIEVGKCAFDGCSSLSTLSLASNALTKVSEASFRGCKSLTSFTVPSTVTCIEKLAFQNSGITSIDLSGCSSLTKIYEEAFSGCTGLKSVSLPSGLTDLKESVFSGCTALSSINLKNTGVTSLPKSCFANCTSLATITLPTELSSVGEAAFSNTALTTFTWPTKCSQIPDEAFKDCKKLASFNINSEVSRIYTKAFYGCDALKTFVSKSEKAPSIVSDAFYSSAQSASTRTLNIYYTSRDSYVSESWPDYFTIKFSTPTAIAIDPATLTVYNGKGGATLKVSPTPAMADGTATWTVDNPQVATIDQNGKLSTLKAGTVTVTATTPNKLTATCKVTVKDVSTIALNKTYTEIRKDYSETLTCSITPAEACQDITWSSSNTNVATVSSSGKVTGVGKGYAIITATSKSSGKTATCEVNIYNPEVKLDRTTALLKPGNTVTITATQDGGVTWSSANSSVATVNSKGVVTAISEGSVVITATANNDSKIKGKCIVTVSNEDFIYVGNIYYKFIDDEPTHLKVTNTGLENGPNYAEDIDRTEYSATVTIPSNISYNGTTYTVTQIGKFAFYRMKDLQMVVLPPTIEIIDSQAFERSENMVRINFSGTTKLHTIKDRAFKRCSKLNYVTLPNSVTKMDTAVFRSCVGLSNLTISTGLKKIPDLTCYDCSILDNLVLPDNIVSIGRLAFRYCTALKNITYSQNLSMIDEFAFANCKALTTVTLPSKVAAIQGFAYYYATNLTTVSTPATLEGIGARCFQGCSSLKSIDFKFTKPISIGESAFYYCIGLTTVNVADLGAWAMTNFANELANPTSKSHSLSYNGTALTSLGLPNTTKYLNQYAFVGCSNITKITIPATVSVVSDHVFKGCTSLSNIVLNATTPPLFVGTRDVTKTLDVLKKAALTVPTASANAYKADAYWKLYHINGSTAEISYPEAKVDEVIICQTSAALVPGQLRALQINNGYEVYWSSNNTSVATVSDKGQAQAIGVGYATITATSKSNSKIIGKCFIQVDTDHPMYVGSIYYMPTAKNNASATSLGRGNDLNYPASTDRYEYSGIVNIPSTVTYDGTAYPVAEISDYDFYDMKHLQKTIIPASVETIGRRAFEDSEDMQRVEFATGSKLSTMKERAFYQCKKLDEVVLPDGLYTIDKSTFRYCEDLKKITLPAKLSMIDEYGFANCISLQNITLPSTLASIQNYCFAFDKVLQTITIPTSTVGIGAFCFRDCSALGSITFKNTQAMTVGESAFFGCSALKATYVDNLDKWVETNFLNDMANPIYFSKNIGKAGKLLKTVVVPSTARFVNQYAFVNCQSMRTVDLPATIQTVSDNIFLNCSALTKVISRNTAIPYFIGTDDPSRMNAVFNKATLYVPDAQVTLYGKDGYWKRYNTILGLSKYVATNDIDVNEDKNVNGADVVALYNYIQAGASSGISLGAADVNSDNAVNGGDVVTIYNYIVNGK